MIPTHIDKDESWQVFASKTLVKECPVVPAYRQGDTLETWIEATALKRGYELCLAALNISLGEQHE
jgi:hypothetical protein